MVWICLGWLWQVLCRGHSQLWQTSQKEFWGSSWDVNNVIILSLWCLDYWFAESCHLLGSEGKCFESHEYSSLSKNGGLIGWNHYWMSRNKFFKSNIIFDTWKGFGVLRMETTSSNSILVLFMLNANEQYTFSGSNKDFSLLWGIITY